jgi:murein tripeptide amidase MpaA
MTITISSSFDAGNIRVVSQTGDQADLEIVTDHMSDFYQWFYFRVAGGAGREITLRITNCAKSAYPHGWPDYKGVMSFDREEWVRIDNTRYADGVLTMTLTPPQDVVWIAYFAPYSMERHHDLVTQTAAIPGVGYRSLGKSLDGQDIDCLTIGEGPLNVWLYARQHPGESMAEWWMEGALEKLVDEDDPVARVLRRDCTFRVVPNMNPDGSRRGHLRTNAVGVNLNREWHAPSAE